MTYQHDTRDSNLNNIHRAMEYRDGVPHLRVNIGSDTVTINGNLNVDNITVDNTSANPVPITGTVTVNQPIAVTDNGGSLTVDGAVSISNFPATQPVSIASMPTTPVTGTFFPATQPVSIASLPNISGTVELGSTTLSALENISAVISDGGGSITVDGAVSVTGTVNIGTMPEVEIKNDAGNPVTVTGTVTANIGSVVTVLVDKPAGTNFSFNNHATNSNRGWTMDGTMRPVVSFQITSTGTTIADIVEILEYEIGNNNANASTIVYEWYEGPLTIAGAAVPAWTAINGKTQYRVYQDQYGSNAGNTFTVPAGTYLRHSGIIIGKNSSGDEGPADLHGGATPNMLTLCMKRVDSAAKLDVWFAFTIRELT